jgi:predicted GNAT family acetyltransferase
MVLHEIANSEFIKVVFLATNSQNIKSWIALNSKDEAIGHIFMSVESNDRIKFLDAWVEEGYRGRGIYKMLWETRWNFVKENYKGYLVYAWCKDSSLPLLLKKGFEKGEIATYVEKKVE